MRSLYRLQRFGQTARGVIYEVVHRSSGEVVFTGTRNECIAWKRGHDIDWIEDTP